MSSEPAANGANAALNGANGHAPNGHSTNGHATGGAAKNGHQNGHVTNGHATNGHATNDIAVKASTAHATAKSTEWKRATNGHATVQPAVKLTGVAKSFGRAAVLTEINLTVAPGELVEVIGPSGAGKTTLLRLVHGQLRPSRGQVQVQGRGLHRWWRRGLGRIRRDVAFVFQEHHLLPRLTALENLTLALQVTQPQLPFRTIKQSALDTLQSLGLLNKRNRYPHQMSAGERQRVAVGRALATRPRVILADEPLASVDDETAKIVIKLLEDAAAGGAAVIIASHRHTFPSSRILQLPTGKIHLNGSHKAANGNGARAAPPLWRLLLPINERPRKFTTRPKQLPLWRRVVAATANSYRLVILSGLRSWSRDVRLTAPALGSMSLLLLLCGTLAIVGVAVQHVAAQQATDASLIRVYLAPDSTPTGVTALKGRLAADPRIASVKDVSPEQALAEARHRPGLDNLASLSETNPFPPSLDVQVRDVTAVGAVAASVKGDPAVDPVYPTSYDPDTYSRVRQVALVVGGIGGGLLLLFGLVAYAVIANSMRGIAAARRQEVAVIRLLGARGWMLRGPFVVEGLMIGALAGAVAAGAVAGAFVLATRFESATYAQVLPGVGPTQVQYVLAAVLVAGLLLGSLTAMLGFRKAHA